MTRGTLFLVAGPSGAGKDTLLNGARAALAGDPAFLFARRTITRPANSGGEDHDAVTAAEFARRADAGGFLLAWDAHGLRYGLPATLDHALIAGRHVIANVSRGVIGEAATRFAPVMALLITASEALLADRLAARGRESAAEIAARLSRAPPSDTIPPGVPTIVLVNDSAPEDGVAKLVAVLTGQQKGRG